VDVRKPENKIIKCDVYTRLKNVIFICALSYEIGNQKPRAAVSNYLLRIESYTQKIKCRELAELL